MNYYIEDTGNGNERTVFTDESRCGDFPECHDETTPCKCDAAECMHCLRVIRPVTLDGRSVWADETRDPYFCPKARDLTHKPCPSAHLHDAMACLDCSYLGE